MLQSSSQSKVELGGFKSDEFFETEHNRDKTTQKEAMKNAAWDQQW